METVPPVVGVHVIVVGSPALIMKPGSRVNGLGSLPCAVAKARTELAMHESERRILREHCEFPERTRKSNVKMSRSDSRNTRHTDTTSGTKLE